jgi:methylglutaconyl-CoA hydratase
MTSNSLTYEAARGIAEITLCRPEKRNALTPDLVSALHDSLKRAEHDSEVRVVLLRGEGKSFCAGGDIEAFSKLKEKSSSDLHAEGKLDAGLFASTHQLRKPLVAAVQGHALGGGLGLVAMSHVVLASQSAVFGATEINIGLFPFNIAPLLIDAIGHRQALELALTGRTFDAAEAHRLGLVHRIVPDDQLQDEATKMAQAIAHRSPLALQLGMEAFAVAKARGHEAFEAMNAMRALVFMSDDLQEGARAFLEKRAPRWTGR